MTTPATKREASTSQLSELLERVKTATGPDHEINLLLGKWQAEIPKDAWVHSQSTNGAWSVTSWANGKDWGTATPYTASIDAALALVEKVLPEANCYGVDKEPDGWTAYVSRNRVKAGHWLKEAQASSAPLAILAALLQALIAKAA